MGEKPEHGSKRIAPGMIDVHAHALPSAYLDGLSAAGVSPIDEDGFPTPSWSERSMLAFMDEQGIGFSVLSVSTPHINRGDDAQAAALSRRIDDQLAELCSRHPDRLGFATTLPLPAVEASIDETRRGLGELGALGVKVPSNACGVYLGDASLDPVMECLNDYGAVVTIHPSRPQEVPPNVFTAGPAPLFEYLADTTRAVLNLVSTGTIERFPRIRWIVPHCGSFLPEVAGRLQGISQVLVPAGLMERVDVMGCLRALYYDLAGDAEPVMAEALLKVADPTHLLYGSDFPYTPPAAIAKKREALRADKALAPLADGIFRGNAASLYGLEA